MAKKPLTAHCDRCGFEMFLDYLDYREKFRMRFYCAKVRRYRAGVIAGEACCNKCLGEAERLRRWKESTHKRARMCGGWRR
jgi:hypothetical protein